MRVKNDKSHVTVKLNGVFVFILFIIEGFIPVCILECKMSY